jgi:HK97 family phage portal protein
MKLPKWISGLFASDGGDRSAWGNFWFTPVNSTGLGINITAGSAMQLSAVFRAVSLVSGHMGMLPIRFYKAGTRKRITKHPLLKLLNVRPNKFQNAMEWREMIQGHLELRGNCYNEITANLKGEITELMPRHPDLVTIEQQDNGDYRYRVMSQDGSSRIVPRGNMWHIRGLSSNGIVGYSVIECARESFGLGLVAQNYGARFFANDAKPTGGWIEYPGQFKDAASKRAFRESVQEAQSSKNKGKLMVMDMGMKYHEVGVSNQDAQFLETRKFSNSEIARWFGVPPHKIGDLEKATFSNIEQQALEYIQDALLPRGARNCASITAELLFDDEEIDVEYDYRVLLKGDSAARRAYYHGGILDGWLTRNEARDMEGYEPLEGLDEPLRPLNMVEENEAEDLEADAEATELPVQEQAEPKDTADSTDHTGDAKESAARLHAVLSGNASRIARRIVKSGAVDTELIVAAMAVSLEKVNAWQATLEQGITLENLTASLLKLGESA